MFRLHCYAVTESVLTELLGSEYDRLHLLLYLRIPGLRIIQCSAGEGYGLAFLQQCCSEAYLGRSALYHQWLLAFIV